MLESLSAQVIIQENKQYILSILMFIWFDPGLHLNLNTFFPGVEIPIMRIKHSEGILSL